MHIIDALRHVTKLSDDESIERVKTNPLVVAVKINYLTDNMDVRRYKVLSEWDVKRLKLLVSLKLFVAKEMSFNL